MENSDPDERVEDDNPKESDKGPVWKVDDIPQLDGNLEVSENSVDKEPEFIEQIEVFDLNPNNDIDETEDGVSKFLGENNFRVQTCEVTGPSKVTYVFIEPYAKKKVCDLREQLQRQQFNISITF